MNATGRTDRPGWNTYPTPDDLPPVVIGNPDLPLVSIVTPSFNQGKFIRQTIESVLIQDYPNIEHWVIDGGSTDETLSILREYEHDPRFHWLSEPDLGQSDAINKGLARCRGELFSFLNSDDVLTAGALQHVVSASLALKQPAIIYGLGRFIDQDGNDLGYIPSQSSSMTLAKLLWVGKYVLSQPATFSPTHFVREIGGIDPTLHYSMDIDFFIRLAERLPLKFIAHDLVLCHLHPASKTVALGTKVAGDVARVLGNAAQRELITERQAVSRSSLFAARVYLTPEVTDVPSALKSLRAAIRADSSIIPEAMLVMLKAVVRLIVGEKRWSKARLIQARVR